MLDKIVSNLDLMSATHYANGDNARGVAYKKAALNIGSRFRKVNSHKLITEDFDWQNIKGVGQGISEKIIRWIKSDFRDTSDFSVFTNTKLVKSEIEYLNTLDINNDQQFYQVIKTVVHHKIPFAIMSKFGLTRREVFEPVINIITKQYPLRVAGSYRRGIAAVHDLDFVYVGSHDKLLSDIDNINKSGSCFIEVIGEGKIRTRVKIYYLGRGIQADIVMSTKEELVYSMLYLTGSKGNNIYLRAIAKSKGYVLNQYGLFSIKTDKRITIKGIGVSNVDVLEERIYKKLGLPYLSPGER